MLLSEPKPPAEKHDGKVWYTWSGDDLTRAIWIGDPDHYIKKCEILQGKWEEVFGLWKLIF